MLKKFLRIFGWFVAILLGCILILTIGTIIFVNTAPQIGAPPKAEDLNKISQSPQFKNGEFNNTLPTNLGSLGAIWSTLPDLLFGKNQTPGNALPTAFSTLQNPVSNTRITWYGHSAFLIEIGGKRILIDPMLGPVSAPISMGAHRFPYQQPIPLEDLTNIDALILSHDHYDHLDYHTITRLSEEVDKFYTPLGVGSHLKHWGIDPEKITELDWWEESKLGALTFISSPARHFSGRSLSDRNATLWSSWIIQGNRQSIYFSGDGGYGPHFREIGQRYGPFDLAMMECGQYNQAWADIHMLPEESVTAGMEVGGKLLMPIHWGAFQLSVHSWTDPIERFVRASEDKNIPIIHPVIGQAFELGVEQPANPWWETIK